MLRGLMLLGLLATASALSLKDWLKAGSSSLKTVDAGSAAAGSPGTFVQKSTDGHRYCGELHDAAMTLDEMYTTGKSDCQSKCDANPDCKFFSIWSDGYCRLSPACEPLSWQHHNIEIWERTETASETAETQSGGSNTGSGGTQGGSGSAAKGDPHLMNIKGEAFDVMQTGDMMLLEIPRGSSPATLDLALRADIERLGAVSCGPTFITSASIAGRWIGVPLEIRSGPILEQGRPQPKHTFGIRFDGKDWLPHVATEKTMRLSKDATLEASDRMFLFQVRGLDIAVSQPKRPRIFLDIQVKGIGKLQTEIGGLLGIDDHSSVEEMPSGCEMSASSLSLVARMEEDEPLQWAALALL